MPPSLDDWVSPDHPARFVVDVVSRLNLEKFYRCYETKGGGRPAYEPEMMLAVILYAQTLGITSSRQIERLLTDDVGFRFIAANMKPDHDTIACFRKRHCENLASVLSDLIQMAMKAGLVSLNHVAVDGTKIRANAAQSSRKSKEELERERERVRKHVEGYLSDWEKTDKEEDERFGKGKNGYLLPDHLSDEEARQKWIEESLKELQDAKQEPPTEPKRKDENDKNTKKQKRRLKQLDKAISALDEQEREQQKKDPTGRLKRERERKHGGKPEVQRINKTDTDARKMMFSDRVYREGYNCQIAVDHEVGIIVAADVTQDANDQCQLKPMVLQTEQNTGWLPDRVSADTGYFNLQHIEDPRLRHVDFYVPPRKPTAKERIDTPSERMREKLDTDQARRIYSCRKTIVEPVFGMIKHARRFGRFLTRGSKMVRAEWMLWCSGHNLLKLYKAGLAPA